MKRYMLAVCILCIWFTSLQQANAVMSKKLRLECIEALKLDPEEQLSEQRVSQAFRALALTLHPDKCAGDQSHANFQLLVEQRDRLLQDVGDGLRYSTDIALFYPSGEFKRFERYGQSHGGSAAAGGSAARPREFRTAEQIREFWRQAAANLQSAAAGPIGGAAAGGTASAAAGAAGASADTASARERQEAREQEARKQEAHARKEALKQQAREQLQQQNANLMQIHAQLRKKLQRTQDALDALKNKRTGKERADPAAHDPAAKQPSRKKLKARVRTELPGNSSHNPIVFSSSSADEEAPAAQELEEAGMDFRSADSGDAERDDNDGRFDCSCAHRTRNVADSYRPPKRK
jgi:curved DNA-binding protein CbpA